MYGAFRHDKPFEHATIIGTLRNDLFGGMNSIVKSYPSRFKAGMEDTYCLMDSMVALAATAVSFYYNTYQPLIMNVV